MESVFISLLSGDLGVTTLLLTFIVAILTKRFVPWWMYEALVAKLKIYEESAPDLLKQIEELSQKLSRDKEDLRAGVMEDIQNDSNKPKEKTSHSAPQIRVNRQRISRIRAAQRKINSKKDRGQAHE